MLCRLMYNELPHYLDICRVPAVSLRRAPEARDGCPRGNGVKSEWCVKKSIRMGSVTKRS